jgi:hypothetical protein
MKEHRGRVWSIQITKNNDQVTQFNNPYIKGCKCVIRWVLHRLGYQVVPSHNLLVRIDTFQTGYLPSG